MAINSIEAMRQDKNCMLLNFDVDNDDVQPMYTDIYTERERKEINLDESEIEINSLGSDGLVPLPPYTEAGVDANFNGGLAERRSMMGGYITMNGTVVYAFCKKIVVKIDNATAGEIHGAFYMGKNIMWIRQIMEDLGIPYGSPTPCAEDNRATHLAANAGKVQKQARHIAVKQTGLQDMTQSGYVKFYLIKGTNNSADHLTKLLSHDGVWLHTNSLIGTKFLDMEHLLATKKRNEMKKDE